jgi:hypothetical protein
MFDPFDHLCLLTLKVANLCRFGQVQGALSAVSFSFNQSGHARAHSHPRQS